MKLFVPTVVTVASVFLKAKLFLLPAATNIATNTRGHAVAQLVEALPCEPEGRGFLSGYCHWNFSFFNPFSRTAALRATQSMTEMSTRNISWWGRG